MDCNVLDYLIDIVESSYCDSKVLIECWYGQGCLFYVVILCFVLISIVEQLDMVVWLLCEYFGVYLYIYLLENFKEIEWVKELFFECSGYLDVYDYYGLFGLCLVFVYGVYLCDGECQCLVEIGLVVVFCLIFNLFFGSGLFDLLKLECYKVKVGFGIDVGVGISFFQLQFLNEVYKVMQLQGVCFDLFKLFYFVIFGGVCVLELDDWIGSFVIGNEVDFVVFDYYVILLFFYCLSQVGSLVEWLFVLIIFGDDCMVKEIFVVGCLVYCCD